MQLYWETLLSLLINSIKKCFVAVLHAVRVKTCVWPPEEQTVWSLLGRRDVGESQLSLRNNWQPCQTHVGVKCVYCLHCLCVRVCARLSEPTSSVLRLLLEPQQELRSTCDQSNRRHLWQDNRVLKRLQNSYESQLIVIFHEHFKTTHVLNEQNWL